MKRGAVGLVLVMTVACGRNGLDGEDGGLSTDAADSGPSDSGLRDAGLSDAGPIDAGPIDAGPIDAGPIDAGALDAGTIDAGALDTGAADAGPPDSGSSPFGPGFDAGACPPLAHPPPLGLSASPRADRYLELLVLHGDPGLLFVDDATYDRAVREKAFIAANDAGPYQFVPTWGDALGLRLDATGIAELTARTYVAWDCLNWAWRATPQLFPWTPGPTGYVYVEVDPVVSLPQLEQDYEALPHVLDAYQNSFGVFATCGYAADTCVSLDGGSWSWLWYSESRQCEHRWFRMRSEADGGMDLERWNGVGLPMTWFDENPACWDQLWATQFRPRDAGP